MKKLVMLLSVILFNSIYLFSQNVSNEIKEKKDYTYIHFGYGTLFTPKFGGINAYFNLQLQNENQFGFGIDLMTARYTGLNLDMNPPVSEVNNYDPSFQGPLPNKFIFDGDKNDQFSAISFHISKTLIISNENGILLNLHLGPSFIFINQRTFKYTFNPASPCGFGGFCFSGGSPSSITAKSSGLTEITLGGYLRASVQVKLGHRKVIEITPFSNINSRNSLFGVQLGIGFGRGYKEHYFN